MSHSTFHPRDVLNTVRKHKLLLIAPIVLCTSAAVVVALAPAASRDQPAERDGLQLVPLATGPGAPPSAGGAGRRPARVLGGARIP